jgi:hypothetical protein
MRMTDHKPEALRLKRKANMKLLAEVLAKVYAEYVRVANRRQTCDEVAAPGMLLRSLVTVHGEGIQAASYRIAQPFAQSFPTYNEDDDDQGLELHFETDLDIADATMLLLRTNCWGCNPSEKRSTSSLPTPTELWWKSKTRSPDNCPLCRKVLFYRKR